MNWGRCVCNRHHRNHAGCHKALWYKTWPSFKLWLDENCHHHDMGVKLQALNLTKLFVKSVNNLTTLWETVVSNENVQKPTKMFGESNSLWYYKSQFQHMVDIIMEMFEMLRHFTKTEKRQLDSPPRLPCWYVSMVYHRKTNTLYFRKARNRRGRSDAIEHKLYCFPDCKRGRAQSESMVQCHACQTWAHYECIGEGEDDIVGIWTCNACRKMPTMVMELIGMVAKLQESVSEMRDTNAQLVGMLSDQRSELHSLREDFNERLPVDTANTHAETTIESPPKPTTLLVGNSLLRNVQHPVANDGSDVSVQSKSGATLADLTGMLETHTHVANVIIVGGTREVGHTQRDDYTRRNQRRIQSNDRHCQDGREHRIRLQCSPHQCQHERWTSGESQRNDPCDMWSEKRQVH